MKYHGCDLAIRTKSPQTRTPSLLISCSGSHKTEVISFRIDGVQSWSKLSCRKHLIFPYVLMSTTVDKYFSEIWEPAKLLPVWFICAMPVDVIKRFLVCCSFRSDGVRVCGDLRWFVTTATWYLWVVFYYIIFDLTSSFLVRF